ncbi:MAG: ADP-ribosylglycohydrolase family protein [Propionibacteriaceae bacterium]|jgi:ADP-ribosylglycohydrolase|nr:ADP-ribosylglycohydrolase family protein [Propionibacteriaceae bacterium]
MLGAIIGDIAGSPYEFAVRSVPVDRRDLFGPEANYTDDTLMTLAVYDGLVKAGGDPARGPAAVTEAMRRIGTTFRPAGKGGFGRGFARWLCSPSPEPYGSCGNGSAMRVSSVGWLFPTLEETEQWARITAAVTHNHPEGIKGAQAVAAAIFLARTGHTKSQILDYMASRFGYSPSASSVQATATTEVAERVSDGPRASRLIGTTCQVTVPEALAAFAEATWFDECVRLAIAPGGDTDTRAAIAGSIAEAYWGIREDWRDAARSRLPGPLADLLDTFERRTAAQRLVAVLDRPRPPLVPTGYRDESAALDRLTWDMYENGLMGYEAEVWGPLNACPLTEQDAILDPATADPVRLVSILIWYIQGEYVYEGLRAAAVRDGTLDAITRRAHELAGLPVPSECPED